MQNPKPKSIRAIRKLKKKQNRIADLWKKTLIVRGNKTSDQVIGFLKDIKSLRKDKSVMYSRKHEIHPYESAEQIQKYCQSTESCLFLFGSHNKKRPNNIVIGRTYENKVLDMVELGMVSYEGIAELTDAAVPINAHPFMIFQGDVWQTDQNLKKLRNLLNDFFYMNQRVKGVEIDKLMSVMICFSAGEDKKVYMKTYKVQMTGANILQQDGKMSLQVLGPNAQFVLRRTRFADTETWKRATYVPKIIKKKENKNIRYDGLGNKRGKIYVDRQNLSNMPSKRKLISKGERNGKGAKDQELKERVENQFAS